MDQNPITESVSGQWEAVMGMMTAHGASRMEIATVAYQTAETILSLTAQALWPEESGVAEEEAPMHLFFGITLRHLTGPARAAVPDATDATDAPAAD